MLKIVVCVKAVPDPKEACKIKIDPATKTLLRCDVPMVVNPLDRNALEAALQLKAAQGAHIVVLSMGPPDAGEIVKECLALGADEGILLSDRMFGGADAFATARTLAKGIEKIGEVDLVLCGMASSDGATEWVGPQMAVFLQAPVVTMVKEIVSTGADGWEVKAEYENGYRRMHVKLPAVFTVTRDLNTPRTLSFSGIIKARKKTIAQWDLVELGAPETMVGLKGSPTIVTAMGTTENKRNVTFIEGTREEKADTLVAKLVNAGLIG
jgi:electron transfer flavoprotein beta subunit